MEIDNSNLMARKRTQWKPPPANWVKLNFDGAAKKEGSAGGGIIRDSKVRMMLAYTGPLGKVSNNTMEVMALYWGIQLVISVGWRDV